MKNMPQRVGRNSFEKDGFYLSKVYDYGLLKDFCCGDCDLDDYFRHDVLKYHEHLLSQAYMVEWATGDGNILVALIDFSNDTVRSEKWRKNHKDVIGLPYDKSISLPAVKITRFGVQNNWQGLSIGTHIINMVKELFLTDNRTGCRLITVDAYNTENALLFYEKNEFQFFNTKDKNKKTRSMFFDLKRLSASV